MTDGCRRLADRASEIIGEGLSLPRPLGGGRNSRVWAVLSDSGRKYVLKQYFRPTEGGAARLRTEWRAFSFLRSRHIVRVPEAVGFDQGLGLAVYGFIEGQSPAANKSDLDDIGQLLSFMSELDSIDPLAGCSMEPAADASLGPEDLPRQIETRLAGLEALADPEPGLREFLDHHFKPERDRRLKMFRPFRLEPEMAILSPSDFGFHNAVRRPDGLICFVDFEYFGWDDPAKLIVDTMLHPHERMSFSPAQQSHWLALMLGLRRRDEALPDRVVNIWPLIGLKWALILLNEFFPAAARRRAFAGAEGGLAGQLRKAESVLGQTRAFPAGLGPKEGGLCALKS